MRSKDMEKLNKNYEKVSIEIISLCTSDVITTSTGAFNTEDDNTEDWF